MEEKPLRVDLETSEAEVLQVASRIFSAYIISNQVTDENEQVLMEKAVILAKDLTMKVDRAVSSGEEVDHQLQNDPNYKPFG